MRVFNRSGFQILEVIIAASILAIVVGAVIALSITSSRNIKRSADVLFAISLAQLTMEKTLGMPYDLITDSPDIYPIYQSPSGPPAGDLFLDFEVDQNGLPTPINSTNLGSLLKQVSDLKIQYQVRVTELNPPDAFASKQILVIISWENAGNTFEYKLSGFISRKA